MGQMGPRTLSCSPVRPWHAHYPAGVAPQGDYPAIPLWGLLQEAARAHPRRVAIVDGDERVTYERLWSSALAVAGWVHGKGVRPGDRVLLRLRNSADFVCAFYGALRAGAIVVPASPESSANTFETLCRDADPRLLIDDVPPISGGTCPEPAAGEVAVLQYTSGTTGLAKGAMMTHRNLVANALQNARWFGWTQGEVNLAVLPLCHTWGLSVCLNSTVAVGGTIVLVQRFDPKGTLDLIARHRVTVLYGSATMFHRLLDRPPRPLPTLRHAKAGAMLSQGRLKERWDEAYPEAPLQQGYGLTEASPECHNNPPQRFKQGTVGIPLQDTDCRISDPDDPGRVLEPGEAGEVCLLGPQVASGYWNRPEETAAAFHEGWLRTDDIGVMDPEGYLTIVDRKKDMMKFRGYTVSPNAVEEHLLAHAGVAEAVVVGRPDDRDGEIPTAFVVRTGTVGEEDLLAHCRNELARYEVPREIFFVDSIPRNEVGKPLRRVLRERLA